jgi:hypothetical protein
MREAKPGEILEDRGFKLRPRALPIVIFDAQQNLPIAIARRTPDVEGVDHVAQVQVTGGRRSKARNHAPIRIA